MTPLLAKFHYHLPMQLKLPKAPTNMRSERLAEKTVSGMEETHRLLRKSVLEAQRQQSIYAGGNDVTVELGNHMYPMPLHFQTMGP